MTQLCEVNHYERIAQAFHESYERSAPNFGYRTREASAVPWEQVPEANRELMMWVVRDLITTGVIKPASDRSVIRSKAGTR